MRETTEGLSPLEERLKLLEERLIALEAEQKVKALPANTEPVTDDAKSASESEAPSKPTSRARVVINKRDFKTGERRDYPADDPIVENPEPQDAQADQDYAFMLRKYRDFSSYMDDESGSELIIVDKELQQLLKTLLQHSPYHIFLGDSVTIQSPFEGLILNWDMLEREARSPGRDDKEQRARDDLKLLLETIEEGSDPKLDEYFNVRKSLKATSSITFDTLWTIFPPGSLVHSTPFLKLDQIFIVQNSQGTWPKFDSRSKRLSSWKLDCWTYDWNGQYFQRYGITLSIEYFEGSRPVSSLLVRPLDAVENVAQLKKNLIKRGESFRKYCTAPPEKRMFQYKGKAFLDKGGYRAATPYGMDDGYDMSPWRSEKQRHKNIDSEVMVDFDSYYKHGLAIAQMGNFPITDDTDECRCGDCTNNAVLQKAYRVRYDAATGDEDWEPEQLMLCPPRLLGHVLREKKWAQLDITSTNEIPHENEDAAFWDKLILAGDEGGRDLKELLHGLIKNHGINEKAGPEKGYHLDDLVEDKGKGLVILLYGPPGVGKTSTAQTIAKAARRPLLSVGVADVGTSAQLVESNLETIFDLATTWKAVLLIDEADVFLQSRGRGQMGATTERNALVSVFLQVLEYYQGILILTTNQIAQFDVAVQSRIHIAIRYEGLDKRQTVDIFRKFLEQYKKRGLVQERMFKQIDNWVKNDLAGRKFDGRQIRNIITSAMGLAFAEADSEEEKRPPLLTVEHLQRVVNYMASFKGDLEYQMRQYMESQSASPITYSG